MNLPTGFSDSGYIFACSVRAFQLVVSKFLEVEFICEMLLNWCVCGRKESPGNLNLMSY